MTTNFPIDFVRQVLEQTLAEEHIANPNKYFGGKAQVNLFSFYEQLQKEDEVNRYVEIYRDLSEQQNRTGLIMNGTIVAPENPTITNINQCLIIPMSFTCSFRVRLEDRDASLETINNIIEILKGRKCDIAEFSGGKLFKVGTVANEVYGTPTTSNGCFLGQITSASINTDMTTTNGIIAYYTSKGITFDQNAYYYVEDNLTHYMFVIKKVDGTWVKLLNNGTHNDIIFPPENETFTKYKLSMSFDSIRCDEPQTLNANEYCIVSFGGSATIVSKGVKLGNDLTKVGVKRTLIKSSTDISITDTYHWLEPLELPSGNNADTQLNKLVSNKFISNTHTDSLAISMQYTFIVDESVDLIKQWFRYARYGIQANGTTISYTSGITPNMIYEISEVWSSWGEVEIETYKAKIVESIDIENTESDTLTITIPFQLQGDNN